jgi:hypothetical protein
MREIGITRKVYLWTTLTIFPEQPEMFSTPFERSIVYYPLILVSCAGGEKTNNEVPPLQGRSISISSLCAEFADSLCESKARCGCGPPCAKDRYLSRCDEWLKADALAAMLQEGTIRYVPEAAGALLDRIRNSCGWAPQTIYQTIAGVYTFGGVFVGTKGMGAECQSVPWGRFIQGTGNSERRISECAESSCIAGRCEPWRRLGDPCLSSCDNPDQMLLSEDLPGGGEFKVRRSESLFCLEGRCANRWIHPGESCDTMSPPECPDPCDGSGICPAFARGMSPNGSTCASGTDCQSLFCSFEDGGQCRAAVCNDGWID